MQHFLHSLTDFFTPRPVRKSTNLTEKLINYTTIETMNDCGEKRYIEMPRPRSRERRENLEVLLTKCKRLLSFVSKKDTTTDASFKIIQLSDRIRMSLYMDDDITPLFDEYEEFEKRYKKNSKSSMNLSSIEHM